MQKRKLIILGFLISAFSADAQLETPQPSPLAKIEQRVGLTDIQITYSRPSIRGRKIFGDLVAYDKLWRTGANYLPTFKFSDDVAIAGQRIPAGEYSFLTIPGQAEWTLILNKRAKLGGISAYNQEDDLLRWKVKPEQYPIKTETFMFNFANLRDNGATVEMIWENTRVAFDIEVFFEERVMKQIEEMLAGPSSRDYYLAARFYHENGKDLNKALEWINLSLAKDERYWVMTTKAKIQADLKDYNGAIATATKAAELSKIAGNDEYVKINNDAIAKWVKMK